MTSTMSEKDKKTMCLHSAWLDQQTQQETRAHLTHDSFVKPEHERSLALNLHCGTYT